MASNPTYLHLHLLHAVPPAASQGHSNRGGPSYMVVLAKAALAGGLASSASVLALHPIDTLKTRVQSTPGATIRGIAASAPKIGVRGLYRGIIPAVGGAPRPRSSNCDGVARPMHLSMSRIANVHEQPRFLLRARCDGFRTRSSHSIYSCKHRNGRRRLVREPRREDAVVRGGGSGLGTPPGRRRRAAGAVSHALVCSISTGAFAQHRHCCQIKLSRLERRSHCRPRCNQLRHDIRSSRCKASPAAQEPLSAPASASPARS